MASRIFISYGREDLETAIRLYNDLKGAGLEPWIDDVDLLPGQNWRQTINRAIKESRHVLTLLSSKSLSKRGYVQKELKTALDVLDEFPPDDVFVIPVRVDECKPLDERLEGLHWVDLFPSYKYGLERILRTFQSMGESVEEDYVPRSVEKETGGSSKFSINAKNIQGVTQAGHVGILVQNFYGNAKDSAESAESLPSSSKPGRKKQKPSAGKSRKNPDPAKIINVLHLSDLHFGTPENARNWYDQVAEDLINDLDISKLDALIISGDIANMSVPEEYQAAEQFLKDVSSEFNLDPSQLVIVPGNHDLNWKLARKGYDFMDLEDYEGNLEDERVIKAGDDAVRVRDDKKYRKRFEHFSAFYESVKGHPYPLGYPDQAILHHFQDQNLLILALNSAWNLDHHFRSRASINPDSISAALKEIRNNEPLYNGCLKLAVFHHPLTSPFEDRITDHGFMQRLANAGFRLALHGHIHKSDKGQYAYDVTADGRNIHISGAGTFGAPVKEWTPGYPLKYNLLRFSDDLLTVETRSRRELNGAWGPDAIWNQGKGKDPLPRYFIDLPDWKEKAPPEPEPPEPDNDARQENETFRFDSDLAAEIELYKEKIESLHENLPVMGFKTRLRVPIRIEEVYVPLRAMVDLRVTGESCFADAEDAEKCLKERGEGREISVPDAFREADRLKRRGIVILGDPGSGKTTHLKRLLIWCLHGGLEELGLPADAIPVFLPLRELDNLDVGIDVFIQNQLDQPHLKMPDGFGERLLSCGNLLLLFDGLDEVAEPDQRVQVSRWIDNAVKVHRSCRFLVTSRFAGYTPEARLSESFIEMHMRPLSRKQAETFIHNWYRSVEVGISSDAEQAEEIAKGKANDLIDRLKQPEFRARRVFAMTRNPLLLTNLCLVHRDRGYLPQSRARLYEECIEVLLELWRNAIGLKGRVTADTGRKVLQPVALWLHGEENRTRATSKELTPVIEPSLKSVGWPHGAAPDFLKAVRDDSGLLTGWDQDSYGFMHLGFQEYLAAREIRRSYFEDPAVIRHLADQFGKGWWQEVILLLLALREEPSLFTPFMREVVKRPAFTNHSDLVEMCFDDALETSAKPFAELLRVDPVDDPELWQRQLYALRLLERLDEDAVAGLIDGLRNHPYDALRKWIQERAKQEKQEVIHSEPGDYELVWIPGGAFMMGSPDNEKGRDDDEGPVHEVTVPPFYMGRYPVTNEEYARFLEANPDMEEPSEWSNRKFNQPKQPVVGVNWHDAKKFAKWAGLDLPSEAQWEYACRAGTTTLYYTGDSEADLDRAGWYSKNSDDQTHPVGEKEPNAFGLYDMHGNVLEWVEDDFHQDYKGAPTDGSAWVDDPRSAYRVMRGGAWGDPAGYCRSAGRSGGVPGSRDLRRGFRLALRPGH